MEEFLIRFGKVIYYGWLFNPTDRLPMQDWQFYNLGLKTFVFGCVSCGILFVAGIAYLVKWRKKNE